MVTFVRLGRAAWTKHGRRLAHEKARGAAAVGAGYVGRTRAVEIALLTAGAPFELVGCHSLSQTCNTSSLLAPFCPKKTATKKKNEIRPARIRPFSSRGGSRVWLGAPKS